MYIPTGSKCLKINVACWLGLLIETTYSWAELESALKFPREGKRQMTSPPRRSYRGERERERERQRDRETETERQTQRDRHRERDRQTETDRQTEEVEEERH